LMNVQDKQAKAVSFSVFSVTGETRFLG